MLVKSFNEITSFLVYRSIYFSFLKELIRDLVN